MNVLITKNEDNVEFYVTGRLDTLTSPELEKTIQDNAQDCSCLTINLKEVDYVSSAGLRVFLAAHKKMADAHGTMKLINVTEPVMDILTMTGFTKILSVERA